MKYEIKQKVYSELQALRDYEQTEASKRLEKFRENAEFNETDGKIRSLDFAIAKATAFKNDCAALETERLNLIEKRKVILKSLNASEKDLEVKIHCKLCNDTGYVSDKPCKCFNTRYIAELKKICDLKYKADFTFADCDLTVVSDPEHRAKLDFLYKTMKLYCQKFPNVKSKNILLMGGTGVGKTCLASAMANALLERGFMVMFITAFDFNRLMLKYHTSPLATRGIYMEDILDCDFLVIDDLGTEQIIRNVTEEYLFQVLSARKSSGKHTMFSTNLNLDQLKTFYGERIFSRMADTKNTIGNFISGTDLRL